MIKNKQDKFMKNLLHHKMRILLLFVLFTLLSVMAIQSNDKTKVNLLFHGAAEKYSQSIGGMEPLETKSMLPTDESLLNSFLSIQKTMASVPTLPDPGPVEAGENEPPTAATTNSDSDTSDNSDSGTSDNNDSGLPSADNAIVNTDTSNNNDSGLPSADNATVNTDTSETPSTGVTSNDLISTLIIEECKKIHQNTNGVHPANDCINDLLKIFTALLNDKAVSTTNNNINNISNDTSVTVSNNADNSNTNNITIDPVGLVGLQFELDAYQNALMGSLGQNQVFTAQLIQTLQNSFSGMQLMLEYQNAQTTAILGPIAASIKKKEEVKKEEDFKEKLKTAAVQDIINQLKGKRMRDSAQEANVILSQIRSKCPQKFWNNMAYCKLYGQAKSKKIVENNEALEIKVEDLEYEEKVYVTRGEFIGAIYARKAGENARSITKDINDEYTYSGLKALIATGHMKSSKDSYSVDWLNKSINKYEAIKVLAVANGVYDTYQEVQAKYDNWKSGADNFIQAHYNMYFTDKYLSNSDLAKFVQVVKK